jgi:MinD superfamily P-loop ATPase
MLIILSSPKGGSGTSVVTASLAIVSSSSTPTLLVDLAGDQAAIMGLPEPPVGINDWTNGMTHREFDEILIACNDNLQLAPFGSSAVEIFSTSAWGNLARELMQRESNGVNIIIDFGQGDLPLAFNKLADMHFMVTRPCYLSLRRAVNIEQKFSGVIVVQEHDRVLTTSDVESVMKLKCVAEVPYSSEISRRVDSGLLISRLPAPLHAALSPLVSLGVSR